MSAVVRLGAGLAAGAALLAAAGAAIPAAAQGPGQMAVPVSFARAVERLARPTVELSGPVESRRTSLVASEVAGLVVELEAREGDVVGRGRPLVRLRRETAELRLRSARAELEEAAARLRLAEANRARAEQLWDDEVISRERFDDALAERDAGGARVERLEAEVARLEDELERTVVRAPFDGVVVEEHVAVGEWIVAGGPVVGMVDPHDLELALEVPEQYFVGLTKGDAVSVRLAAAGDVEVVGTVRALVPAADGQARTFPVKIALPDLDGKASVGMLARARLPVDAPRRMTLVPKDAVVSQGSARVVYRIGEDETVAPVEVVLGEAQGAWIAVEGAIAAGDRVVTQGGQRLRPGQPVAPSEYTYEIP